MTRIKKNCPVHGEYIAHKNPLALEGFEDYETACPQCEMILRHEEENQLVAKLYGIARDLEKRGIEPEFFEATLENYRPETETEKEALRHAQEMADGKIKKLLLLGDYGTGKTHLGNALVAKLKGKRVTMYELSAKIRQGYNTGASELDVLDELLTYPLIFIDEVGRTKGSESELNWLSYLIDKCHTRGIKIIMASNKHQAKNLPTDKKDQAFERWLPNDVISRLRQDSALIEIKGRDRRCGGEHGSQKN